MSGRNRAFEMMGVDSRLHLDYAGFLIEAGIPADHLHWESFGGAQNDDQNS